MTVDLKRLGGGDHPTAQLVAWLSSAQNHDGGWGYGSGTSWTEPTVYALLVFLATNSHPDAIDGGVRWLKRTQRSDGGWPPTPGVDLSTWATALGIIALAGAGAITGRDPSVEWILRQSGAESNLLFRLRQRLLGSSPDYSRHEPGWPWYPGAAAWVIPTAMSILALTAMRRTYPRTNFEGRIREGRDFLMSRICRDGGWNHGSSRSLGYESDSYPETTGIALLALAEENSAIVRKAVECAKRHLQTCRSPLGIGWLQLGLLASGLDAGEIQSLSRMRPRPLRELSDVAVTTMARAALVGRNIWLG
jgi:hypothetical protein